MFYILTASADTYITNKVIDNKFMATDANVGRAGTLDLFKLWDESTYISASTRITSSVDELSRILIKFDYDDIAKLASTSLDLNHPSFQVKLELFEAVLNRFPFEGTSIDKVLTQVMIIKKSIQSFIIVFY